MRRSGGLRDAVSNEMEKTRGFHRGSTIWLGGGFLFQLCAVWIWRWWFFVWCCFAFFQERLPQLLQLILRRTAVGGRRRGGVRGRGAAGSIARSEALDASGWSDNANAVRSHCRPN